MIALSIISTLSPAQKICVDARTWDSIRDYGIFLEDAYSLSDSTIKILRLDVALANEQIKWRDANLMALERELGIAKGNIKVAEENGKRKLWKGRKEGFFVGALILLVVLL